jgi:hypothetical protein
MILVCILERWNGVVWTRLVCLKIGTSGELLRMLHKILGNYGVASQLLGSRVVFSSIKLVN